jgi:GTP-binding protein
MTRLCRVYVLLNAKHGANEADKLMLQQLDDKVQSGGARWTLQAIITKADLVSDHKQQSAIEGISRAIFENAPTCLPPIVTASLKSNGIGVNDVRRSIVEACGLAPSQR